MKTKSAFLFITIGLVFSLTAGAKQHKPDKSIVILHENDVHCAIDGYTHLAGLRDAIADTAYVAVVSCGDFVQGGTAGAISRGQYVADIMRTVGYDAITLGNHEFDYPVSHTAKLLKHIGAPVVCANLCDTKRHKAVYAPFVIKRFGKTKVAFIGVVTPTTLQTEMSAFFDGDKQIYDLQTEEVYNIVQKAVDKARRKGADYVVVLSHLGEDPNYANVESHGLINATRGIDILLDGHTHNIIAGDSVLSNNGNKIVVAQTGTAFQNIGKVLISPDGKITNTLIPANEFKYFSNPQVSAATDSIHTLMRELTQRIVCHSDVRLRILDEQGKQLVRMAETNLGDLVTDAYRVISGADISLANGGGIRKEKFAGDLTYGDIADILPYDNNLWVVEATGQDIINLLQKNTSYLPVEDGSFPQVSGLRFTTRISDHSVSDVEVLDSKTGQYEPIDPEKTYTIATIDYCVTGGGFYDMLRHCRVISRGDRLYRDILVDYLEQNLNHHISNDYAEPQDRIRILP